MFRGILSVAFAAFLLAIVTGYYHPDTATADAAMRSVAVVGLIALLYSAFNSFNALRYSMGQSTRVVYLGLVFAFLPMLIVAYSVAVWQYSPAKLTTFQVISMLFGGVASLIDVVFFSWLTFWHTRAPMQGLVGRRKNHD